MNEIAVIILSATAGAFVLGTCVGFYLGKIRGMKLGIEARAFAESFGIGSQGMQASASNLGSAGAYTLSPQDRMKKIKVVGGGMGQIGGFTPFHTDDLGKLFTDLVQAGMNPSDANKVITQEAQRRNQQAMYAAVLGAQNQKP